MLDRELRFRWTRTKAWSHQTEANDSSCSLDGAPSLRDLEALREEGDVGGVGGVREGMEGGKELGKALEEVGMI